MIDLVMIVRNEAEGIERTLRSFMPHMRGAVVVDTGSEDGTQQIVDRTLAEFGKPYLLGQTKFENFSQARNYALDLQQSRIGSPGIGQPLGWPGPAPLTLMVDADDILESGGELLEQKIPVIATEGPGKNHAGFFVTRRLGIMTWDVPLLLRSSADLRYEGEVHEAISLDGVPTLRQVVIRKEAGPKSTEKSRARWEKDLNTLRLAAGRGEPRAAFYYAQTFELLGRKKEALAAYEFRIELQGLAEESCIAWLRIGRLRAWLGHREEYQLQALQAALGFQPTRPEVNAEIAGVYWRNGNTRMARLYANRAIHLGANSRLFREEEGARAVAQEILKLCKMDVAK